MKDIYIQDIAHRLGVKAWQVENCEKLFEEGSTIPFISRYRKERTGGLDDVAVAEIRHWTDVFNEMEKRKETILGTISQAGALTDELKGRIEKCVDSRELEDLYLPFRPKRRTRATVAKEAGLEPLADAMYSVSVKNPEAEARKYVGDKVASVEDALAGARDIIAERLNETASVRETLRQIFETRRIVTRATKKASSPEAQKYKGYFQCSEPISRIAPHRLLAMLRAENEGFITLKIDADPEKCGNKMYYDFCQERHYPAAPLAEQIREAIDDAYKRLLEPSISNEVLQEAKEKADIESIKIFGENLRQLLLAPPVGQKRILAIDPGFRTGCKVVCLDGQGNLLHNETIYPHPPANEKIQSIRAVSSMVEKYGIEVIAIGSGTAGRETEEFIKRVPLPERTKVYMVSEDGASIYSASEIGRAEFPDYDVTVRGAVSIGRRLMDPLAELVKIDPKSLGVGQYQHDVDQNLLKEKLDNTVESCVNSVGVNLNTASPYLLSYVAGIGPALAENIIEYRTEHGAYRSREELKKVKRLGEKAFEQCAGFLRIPGADNPLDNSAVHPECYHIVRKMAADLGTDTRNLVGSEDLCSKIQAEDYIEDDFGLPTINDIINELKKPGRDPRANAAEFSFAEDIHSIEDLVQGMELPGIVTNITAFGAFVDIGIKQNGLIHVSKMGVRGLTDPSRVLKLHQHIVARVLSVDTDRNRISLELVK
ncbi:MAG: RNA-binding transcriptional accessory protein [Bacteroidetes bacterium]|uniref:RNA-binding transcriptional accessory protein n=1 Tax=Candidatus Cryptobacteroides faecigallinarum TaxID=2840763 RepID=A0A9D9IP59_9BACT|nr:RNA-binding transcriptional accessory protein [Candidatus Cryptobacteroides faecigallinarum]